MLLEMLDYVKKIIVKHYGDGKLQNIEFLSAGRINNIFKVTLRNCEFDEVVVRLRYFHDECFGQRFGTEIMVDDILKECIQYPKLIAYDASKAICDSEYSILPYIKGRGFCVETESEEQFERLGKMVRKIHNSYVPKQYRTNFNSRDSINEYYKKRFTGIISDSKKYDKHMYDLIQDTMKYYYPDEYKTSDISLTHHDLHERNLIVGIDNEMTLLDWESAKVEATEVEFIRAKYYLLNRATKSKVDAFVRGYGEMHFTDNFFMQEIMWLARISNFERVFPPKDAERDYWCSSEYLSKCLEELILNYKGRGTYKSFEEIITYQTREQSIMRSEQIER